MKMIQNLEVFVDEAFARSKQSYFALHRIPERGCGEFGTSEHIYNSLTEMGYTDIIRSGTGMFCSHISQKGPFICFRADMDGFPVSENTGLSFSSCHSNMMHACGHDAHMAGLLGFAGLVKKMAPQLTGNYRFIFEPDEEGRGGARDLIEKGCLDNASSIFGLHVAPELNSGTIGIKYGRMHPRSDVFRLRIMGTSSHGAKPEEGSDALYCMSEIIMRMQSIITRRLGPSRRGLITFGTIKGGNAGNAICADVTATGIIRSENAVISERMRDIMADMISGSCSSSGCTYEFDVEEGYPELINDDAMADNVADGLTRFSSLYDKYPISVVVENEHSMTVDSFAYYLQHVPGTYVHLGCCGPGSRSYPLHSDKFIIDIECLRYGIQYYLSRIL